MIPIGPLSMFRARFQDWFAFFYCFSFDQLFLCCCAYIHDFKLILKVALNRHINIRVILFYKRIPCSYRQLLRHPIEISISMTKRKGDSEFSYQTIHLGIDTIP